MEQLLKYLQIELRQAHTYIAAALTNGKITINKIDSKRMDAILLNLKKAGAHIISNDQSITLDMRDNKIMPVDIITEPFPDFPLICKLNLLF